MSCFLPLQAVTPFTLQDFPDRLACIIWVGGCNLRCGYCHNPEIVRLTDAKLAIADVLAFLSHRRAQLDGVVISGGEATLWPDLVAFISEIRTMGFAIKLDTNGTRPAMLSRLINEKLLDYIALDYKAPPQKFQIVTGASAQHLIAFQKSLELLCTQDRISFEIRTTVHTCYLDSTDLLLMRSDLAAHHYKNTWYIQNFSTHNRGTLGHLGPQKQALDLARLLHNSPVTIAFRNFTCTNYAAHSA